MSEQIAVWYKAQGEYITGALFALVALDIYMFLMYCITEKTAEGYGLGTLLVTTVLAGLAWIEKLYSQQDNAH